MPELWKKYKRVIGTIIMFVIGGSLAVVFNITDNLRAIWVLPEYIVVNHAKIEARDHIQDSIIMHLSIANRRMYFWAMDMTDNVDTIEYEIATESGAAYDVSIRQNNEEEKSVFIKKLWVVYPLGHDPDGRPAVLLDDFFLREHEEDAILIYKKNR